MKIQRIVKMLLGTGVYFVTNALAFYTPTTSHFGHGEYRCYYLNIHTKKFYEGIDDKKHEAEQKAHDACKPSIITDRLDCELADCRFK